MSLKETYEVELTMGTLQRMPRFRAAAGEISRRTGAVEAACAFITAALERIAAQEDLGVVNREILLMKLEKPLP